MAKIYRMRLITKLNYVAVGYTAVCSVFTSAAHMLFVTVLLVALGIANWYLGEHGTRNLHE